MKSFVPPIIKKRGRKPKNFMKQKNIYNGEVKIKTCYDKSPLNILNNEKLELNLDLPVDEIPSIKSSLNEVSNDYLIPIIQNPSPGRNRRSGVLFKKKQYQPVKASPLLLNCSPTNAPDILIASPTNANLNILNSSETITESAPCNESKIYLDQSAIIVNENSDPNIIIKCTQRRRSSSLYENVIRLQDHTSKPVYIKNSNETGPCIEDTIDNILEQDGGFGQISRKRTYSSSANSDSENHYSKRKMNHKRGRQKSVNKLCLKDEFKDLEGLNDIKCGVYMIASDDVGLKDPKSDPETLDMLTLVWAKCKGYPSYPALVITFL